jgi:GntR family transcriptional repressor for pyruvate dehydrogenase complex
MNIRPIKPKRVSSQVFEQIRELIYRGEFKPGQQLPPERELAASMEVSRTSVRNAIENLIQLGLLRQTQGHGTFICSPEGRDRNPFTSVMATDDATYIDLLEVRRGFECNAARLAAQRASELDLLAIKKSLDEMEEGLAGEGRISTSSDTAFHMAVAYSTKNPVLIHLIRWMYDFLFVGIKKNLSHMGETDHLDDVMEHHRAIYRHIKRREPERAHDAMCVHLQYVQEFFANRSAIIDPIPLKHLAA